MCVVLLVVACLLLGVVQGKDDVAEFVSIAAEATRGTFIDKIEFTHAYSLMYGMYLLPMLKDLFPRGGHSSPLPGDRPGLLGQLRGSQDDDEKERAHLGGTLKHAGLHLRCRVQRAVRSRLAGAGHSSCTSEDVGG